MNLNPVVHFGVLIIGAWLAGRVFMPPDAAPHPKVAFAEVPLGLATTEREARGEIQARLRDLSHEHWEVRDRASQWLVANRARWVKRVEHDWLPADAEGRWRLQQVLDSVRRLEDLPRCLAEEPFTEASYCLSRLAREFGIHPALEAAAPMLRHPAEHVRERVIRLLDGLEGFDPREMFTPLVADPSPWVRETLCRVALVRDPGWAEDLLESILDRGPEHLSADLVKLAARLRNPRLFGLLRDAWERAGGEIRDELALALCGVPCYGDQKLVFWMLRSGEYRLVMPALGEVELAKCSTERLETLMALLVSPIVEARLRACELVRSEGDARLAPWLLPLLESGDTEQMNFALGCLAEWRASDYFGDAALALEKMVVSSRRFVLTRQGDAPALVPLSR